MPTIYISIKDSNLDFGSETFTESFEVAEQKFDQMKRNYERRVAMELDKGDVHGEASKEESF